jgi:hypothetical protein
MSWLEFAANIIDNVLSWPVAVLLVVPLLRKQLRELFHTIENFVLEAGGTRVSFTRSLERAREGVAAAKSDRELGAQQETEYLLNQFSYILDLAQRKPASALAEAYERFKQEQINRLAHDKDLPAAGNERYLLQELNAHGVVPDAIVDSVRNLSSVHYEVTTAKRDPSPSEAVEYAQIALEVGRYLNALRGEDTKPQLPPWPIYTLASGLITALLHVRWVSYVRAWEGVKICK